MPLYLPSRRAAVAGLHDKAQDRQTHGVPKGT
jgi:hypothetical protein